MQKFCVSFALPYLIGQTPCHSLQNLRKQLYSALTTNSPLNDKGAHKRYFSLSFVINENEYFIKIF